MLAEAIPGFLESLQPRLQEGPPRKRPTNNKGDRYTTLTSGGPDTEGKLASWYWSREAAEHYYRREYALFVKDKRLIWWQQRPVLVKDWVNRDTPRFTVMSRLAVK